MPTPLPGSCRGAAESCGLSLTTGGVAPRRLCHDRLTPVAPGAGFHCLEGDPLVGCVLARLPWVVAMVPGNVCHCPQHSLARIRPPALGYRPCCRPGGQAGSCQSVCPVWCCLLPPVTWPPWACMCLRCLLPLDACSLVCVLGVVCAWCVVCRVCVVSIASWHLFTCGRAVCALCVVLVLPFGLSPPSYLFLCWITLLQVFFCSLFCFVFCFLFLKTEEKRGNTCLHNRYRHWLRVAVLDSSLAVLLFASLACFRRPRPRVS